MTSTMQLADLKLVDQHDPRAQKVAVLQDAYNIEMRHAEIPEPAEDEIRIKIKYVGICGSDVETYRGIRQPEFVSIPGRLGHEVSGTVDKIGDQVNGVRIGDKVACRYVWGAFAEYIVCKPFNVKVLPEWFPMLEISTLEVLPGIIHAAELSQLDTGKDVLITGQGVSGLVLTQVFNLFSPRNLVVTDLHDFNLELARKYGATHAYKMPSDESATMERVKDDFPDGFHVVVPALLEGDGMVDALDALAFGGRIVMYGCIGTCHKSFDFFKLHRKRGDIFSTEPKRDIDMRRYFEEGKQMMLDGVINTREMITHKFPLEKVGEAFRLRDDKSRKGVIHILIDCEGGEE